MTMWSGSLSCECVQSSEGKIVWPGSPLFETNVKKQFRIGRSLEGIQFEFTTLSLRFELCDENGYLELALVYSNSNYNILPLAFTSPNLTMVWNSNSLTEGMHLSFQFGLFDWEQLSAKLPLHWYYLRCSVHPLVQLFDKLLFEKNRSGFLSDNTNNAHRNSLYQCFGSKTAA